MKKDTGISIRASERELSNHSRLSKLLKRSPLGNELLWNLYLYMPRQSLMRLLFFHDLYRQIIHTHGVVMEFGCKWGSNLSLFTALRGIYEPYNHNRKVIGFDTFQGLEGISEKDGRSEHIKAGAYSTSENYDEYLREVLDGLEAECPIPQIRKSEIIKGDVRETLKSYLDRHPEMIVALAYFDMDIYEPTVQALRMLQPHLTKGSIIGFDEMNWPEMPGPSLALKEVFGYGKYKVHRTPMQPIPGYIMIE